MPNIQLFIFTISVMFIHISYLAIFFGVAYLDKRYVEILNVFIQLSVTLFLIVRFFPLKSTHELTKLDVSIIFYCATFLFLNIVLVQLYNLILLPLGIIPSTLNKTINVMNVTTETK
jgi:hypothetical protein